MMNWDLNQVVQIYRAGYELVVFANGRASMVDVKTRGAREPIPVGNAKALLDTGRFTSQTKSDTEEHFSFKETA